MQNVHRKFIADNVCSISYALFCRLRPFWVVIPKESDRATCQCHTHEKNLQFIADKLFECHLIATNNVEVLADSTVCNTTAKDGMYGDCKTCMSK